IAKGLVELDAVHINGDALRRALQRRGEKAAIAELLRRGVTERIRQRDARNELKYRTGDKGRTRPREIFRGQAVHRTRQLVAIDAAPGQRGGSDDFNLR